MWQAQEFVHRIGKVLHTKDDDISPLPERWVDLIRYLDQKERQESEAFQRRHPAPARYSTRGG